MLEYFVLGAFASFVLDVIWYTKIRQVQKVENSNYFLKIHEHYNIGLEMLILGIILAAFSEVSAILIGFGFGFIIAEWKQGNPFAHKSSHFKASTIIGIVLIIILITIMLK